MRVGKRILIIRTEKGMEQQTLADLSGVSQGHLSMIENNPTMSPRLSTIQKIAKALNVPVAAITDDTELLQEDDNLDWFWRKRFATFKASEILRYRNEDPSVRIAWTVKQLLDYFQPEEVVARLQQQPLDHLNKIAAGQVRATDALIDILVEQANVPEPWLLNGEPPASDPLLRKVLQHRDASAYLAVICTAIDEKILPELLEYEIEGLLKMRRTEKPPT